MWLVPKQVEMKEYASVLDTGPPVVGTAANVAEGDQTLALEARTLR